jgi:hypothetical protein
MCATFPPESDLLENETHINKVVAQRGGFTVCGVLGQCSAWDPGAVFSLGPWASVQRGTLGQCSAWGPGAVFSVGPWASVQLGALEQCSARGHGPAFRAAPQGFEKCGGI